MSNSPHFRSSFAAPTGFVAAVTPPKARTTATVTRLPAPRIASPVPSQALGDRAAA